MIFQIIALIIGFITVYNGYSKKAFLTAIIAAGIFSTIDLSHHYLTKTGFHITRVLDMVAKSEYSADWNHNFFGMIIGISFVTTYVLSLCKQLNKKLSYFFITLAGLGVIISTSRGALLSLFVSVFVGTLIIPRHVIDVKKIFAIAFSFLLLFLSLSVGFFFILSDWKREI